MEIDNVFKGKIAERAFELEYSNYGFLAIKGILSLMAIIVIFIQTWVSKV